MGSSGIFLPSSSWDTQTYASKNLLVLSGEGFRLANVTVTDGEVRDCQVAYDYTFLVTFDLDGAGKEGALLGAAGDVEGSILSGNRGQFSMDYFDDHLRVAASSTARYGYCPLEDGDKLWKRFDPAKSQVSVLKEESGDLVQVGITDDLGTDATIASVRFLGDRGYVSSRQEGDPLYVIDLSVPSSPRKTGYLNVTDSLNYMHPVSSGSKLLAVGSASPDDADNGVYGLKISLFDVADASNPYEEQSYVFETIGYSEALSDHHAFRYIPQNGMLIIPGHEESWQDKAYFDGAWLFRIDPDNAAISPADSVRHAGVNEMTNWFCWNPSRLPSRSMMFNGNLLTMMSHSIAMSSTTIDGNTTISNIINLDEGRAVTKNDDCSQYRGYYRWWGP